MTKGFRAVDRSFSSNSEISDSPGKVLTWFDKSGKDRNGPSQRECWVLCLCVRFWNEASCCTNINWRFALNCGKNSANKLRHKTSETQQWNIESKRSCTVLHFMISAHFPPWTSFSVQLYRRRVQTDQIINYLKQAKAAEWKLEESRSDAPHKHTKDTLNTLYSLNLSSMANIWGIYSRKWMISVHSGLVM